LQAWLLALAGIEGLARVLSGPKQGAPVASALGAAVGPAVGAAVRAWRSGEPEGGRDGAGGGGPDPRGEEEAGT